MVLLNIMCGAGRKTRCQWMLVFFALWIPVQGKVYEVKKCPHECECLILFDTEHESVLRVQCLKGGMVRLPLEDIDRGVYKIFITPPKEDPNLLTIGPIFTHPDLYAELREIHITNSNVPSIGQNAFWGLQHLRLINLTYNKITRIGQDNFRGLLYLADLDISHNRINNMASDTFLHCTNLKRLYVTHNNITHLNPRLFRTLIGLQTLDLSMNPISDLNPEVFKDIQQLLILKCRGCYLSRVNAHVYNLASNLEEIDLGYNKIKYLLADDFQDLKKLKKLSLDGNQISAIVDYVFSKNGELQELNLANNKLALLSQNSLTNLSRLIHLDIGQNKLDRFYLQTFSPIVDSLRSIIFSGNNMPLNEVAIILQILPDLHDVGLANLSLPEIPPNFFIYNQHLTGLDISGNKLTEFPLKLLSKTKFLQRLDISNNLLSKLEEPDLHRLEAIPDINLSKNRWKCNQCSVGMMLVYMGTTVLNGSLRHLRCFSPLKLRSTPLRNLNLEELEECRPTHESQVSVIAGLVLVLVAALAALTGALCCTRHRAQRYYTHEEKRRERDPDHPEELLPHTELGTLATTHAPFSPDNNS